MVLAGVMFNKPSRSKSAKVTKTVSLDKELAESLDQQAAKENRTTSNLVETLLLKQMEAEKVGEGA